MLRALVISPDTNALQHIEEAFHTTPDVELALFSDWSAIFQNNRSANVLILHGDTPIEGLRQLRRSGFNQPALILSDAKHATALEADLTPVENITWALIKAGGLPNCVTLIVDSVTQ